MPSGGERDYAENTLDWLRSFADAVCSELNTYSDFFVPRRSNSGSLAKFTAMRRASSFVSSLAASRPGAFL